MVDDKAAVEKGNFDLEAMVELFVADLGEIERIGERCGFSLPIGGYKKSFDYDRSRVVVVDGYKEDFESFSKRILYVSSSVSKLICKEIVSQVPRVPVGDFVLRGSSYFVAVKLVLKRLGGVISRSFDGEYQLDVDLKILDVGLGGIIDSVHEAYEREYMRYRLWTDASVSRLGEFLFLGAGGYSAFDGPAFWAEEYRSEPRSVEDFVEAVDEIMAEFPVVNNTEAAFPEEGPKGIIFAEYVPVGLMSRDLLEKLYGRYLSWAMG